MNRVDTDGRYRLTVARGGHSELDLAGEVARGLRSRPKSIPCRFFYDAAGSRLFEEICELPEYYLTRAEDEILARRATEIAASVPRGAELVELGSGSAKKTRRIIEACLARSRELQYVPVDISRSALEQSSRVLLDSYPALHVHAVAGEYRAALEQLRDERDQAKLVLWLGSNVGNLDRVEAARFLREVGRCLGTDDRVLVGIDLRKSKEALEAAYDDSRGVTARFNSNVLARINAELRGRFDLRRFRHVAHYDEAQGRIEMHLESVGAQHVRIDALDIDVAFDDGERIHTESSYKYSPDEIRELARSAELELASVWLDSREQFSLNLFAPAARSGRAPDCGNGEALAAPSATRAVPTRAPSEHRARRTGNPFAD
jgi:dimethylhistidine N-methyltransferase